MPAPLPPPERAIVIVVNTVRASYGLPRLRVAHRLSRTAERHSIDQLRRDWLGHTSSDGTSASRRIARSGSFRVSGEVIAFTPRGSASRARSVVRMWLRSPAHRDRLLDARYRVLGVGRVRGALGPRRGAIVTADLAAR